MPIIIILLLIIAFPILGPLFFGAGVLAFMGIYQMFIPFVIVFALMLLGGTIKFFIEDDMKNRKREEATKSAAKFDAEYKAKIEKRDFMNRFVP